MLIPPHTAPSSRIIIINQEDSAEDDEESGGGYDEDHRPHSRSGGQQSYPNRRPMTLHSKFYGTDD